MLVLTREEMYAYDRYTIEKIGIPGRELMENAGRGSAEFLQAEVLKKDAKIAVFCGNGNNGGDGFVIARYLYQWKYEVEIFLTGDIEKMSRETRENLEKCRELDIGITDVRSGSDQDRDFLAGFDIIIDAILGIGLTGTLQGWRVGLIEAINRSTAKIIAIDIPSGLDADLGKNGIAIRADYTLTMAALKQGLILESGREFCGEVKVIDIGIPCDLEKIIPPRAKIVSPDNVKFPVRNRLAHKGDYGRIGIIAGSPGYSGAAILASRAALRAGGGLITLFHPPGMELIFENQLLEVMTRVVPHKNNKVDLTLFETQISPMDVLLIGPGIGINDDSRSILDYLLKNWEKPLVLDADAINIISINRDLLDFLPSRLLLPHVGEFTRLSELDAGIIKKDPIKSLQKFTSEYETKVLLKSATSIYCDADNLIFDISGNDGLATGGSGDVLAGIVVSFLGQKLDYKNAAVSASYLLGMTAEKLAVNRKTPAIIPSDIIEALFLN